ncbi:hypothetical protein [Fibrobacter sp.]|uniref:hypothetical protein n=1 Tax=Fibrobacter sp. TaxID=35828 RepID=UPI00388DAB04
MKNDVKILERAEIYLRKLSSGLNPLDDSVLAETDVCRQERIGKCLLFVADYLRKQAASVPGSAPVETAQKQKKQKAPREARPLATKELVLDAETLAKFEFSDEPVSVSSVVRSINALLPAGNEMMPLMYADIAEILSQDGILEKQSGERGRETNLPTVQGEVLGFTKAEAEIRGRHAVFTKCNRNAQQYIINNIQKCVAQANERLAKRLANAAANASSAASGADDASPARAPRAKFTLTAEELQKYPADETPVPVTEIARRLNDLLPAGANIQQIYFKTIRDWFVANNYLQETKNVVGKVSFAPTEAGLAAGIVTEQRVGKNGENYEAVLYNGAAQKLVLEHVNELR